MNPVYFDNVAIWLAQPIGFELAEPVCLQRKRKRSFCLLAHLLTGPEQAKSANIKRI
jgi:hypothetical protein